MNMASLTELFSLGGPFMWPLLAFSLAAVAIIAERCVWLATHSLRIDRLAGAAFSAVAEGRFEEEAARLRELGEKETGAPVLVCLLENADLPRESLEKAVETEAKIRLNEIEGSSSFLSAIGSLAPLTGFLGTVSGMIGAFRSISQAAEVNAQLVADGIYEALITTVFGLIIAIIAITANYLFGAVNDRFAIRTENCCARLVAAVCRRSGQR